MPLGALHPTTVHLWKSMKPECVAAPATHSQKRCSVALIGVKNLLSCISFTFPCSCFMQLYHTEEFVVFFKSPESPGMGDRELPLNMTGHNLFGVQCAAC